MTQTITITSKNNLVLPEEIMARYKTKKFSILADDDMIFIEPAIEDDGKDYYEPTVEGEKNLKQSIAESKRGELYPIETLFD